MLDFYFSLKRSKLRKIHVPVFVERAKHDKHIICPYKQSNVKYTNSSVEFASAVQHAIKTIVFICFSEMLTRSCRFVKIVCRMLSSDFLNHMILA